MNALAAAIPAIANESAIATAPATPASRPAESPTPATKSTAKSTATSSAESTAARSTSTTAARSNGSTWNTARLAFDPRSRQAPGRLNPKHGPAQSEIILTGLQAVAQRSVHQESFVGV